MRKTSKKNSSSTSKKSKGYITRKKQLKHKRDVRNSVILSNWLVWHLAIQWCTFASRRKMKNLQKVSWIPQVLKQNRNKNRKMWEDTFLWRSRNVRWLIKIITSVMLMSLRMVTQWIPECNQLLNCVTSNLKNKLKS